MALQISPAAPPAAARPPLAEPTVAPDADFAQLMARQQATEPAPVCAPPPNGRGPRHEDARTPRGRAPATATSAAPSPSAPGRDEGAEAAAEARRADDTATPADGVPLDPGLSPWLAPLPRPATDASAAPTLAATDAPIDALPTGKPARPALAAPERAALRAPEAAARHAEPPAAGRTAVAADREDGSAALAAARASDEATNASLPSGADTLRAASATTPAAVTTPPSGVEAPGPAQGASGPAGAPLEMPTPTASVPVPLDAPDFGHAFGVQVSVLAREGVHKAELHLNPAEMGPVSVQIALDGERARIDFGAQAAATRAAIEASLPELAAALRDAGLTLAGGGVSQGFGQRGGAPRDGNAGERGDGPSGRVDAGAAAPARPAWRGRARAGGVDLYA